MPQTSLIINSPDYDAKLPDGTTNVVNGFFANFVIDGGDPIETDLGRPTESAPDVVTVELAGQPFYDQTPVGGTCVLTISEYGPAFAGGPIVRGPASSPVTIQKESVPAQPTISLE